MPQTSADNPLLSLGFRVPFDHIRAEHVEPAAVELLSEARTRLDAVAAEPGERTFANTMQALDWLTEPLDRAMGVVRHLESVATYPELRASFNAVQPEVSAFYTGIPLHQGLWKAIKTFAGTLEGEGLQGARRRYLHKTMDTFRRHGADLDPAGKKRLEEIDVELTQLTTRFSENVLDSTNAFELLITDEAALAGLPPTAVESARQSAERKAKPGWRFTLQAPDYFAVMTYLDDAGVRQRLYEAYSVRATEAERDNRPLITRILELRRTKAELLGFLDFADLVLEDRMAHTGGHALAFLEDLRPRPSGASTRKTRNCWSSGGRRKARGPRRSHPGTSLIMRRSNGRRCTPSTRRRYGRIFRWRAPRQGCSAWWNGSTASR